MRIWQHVKAKTGHCIAGLVLMATATVGCGGSGGIGNDAPETNRQPDQWHQHVVAAVEAV